ncbi:MAG: hypothetical protein ACTHLB_15610 [Parafilimonas sp.]
MKWLKRRYKCDDVPGKDKVARCIVICLLKVQTGFARFMNKQAEKISSFSMKVLLVIFFLTGSALSIYFIVAAVIEKEQLKAVKVDRLSIPRYYNKDEADIQDNFLITEQQQVQAFKKYMNSLQQTKVGKTMYDSIMLHRPGLMDSIIKLEQLYQSQHKK